MNLITKKLTELKDDKYKDFLSKLVPNLPKENFLGVKVPTLRALGKTLAADYRNEALSFLEQLPHRYIEENFLHAFLLGEIFKNIDEFLPMWEKFLPYIDNWAVCDSSKPKIFAKNLSLIHKKCEEWLTSEHTYTRRFAIVTLMDFFSDKLFDEKDLTLIENACNNEFYVQMAIAWYYSIALIKQYEIALPLFEAKRLPAWVHNKSIQKARESYRISPERKDYLNSLKIK